MKSVISSVPPRSTVCRQVDCLNLAACTGDSQPTSAAVECPHLRPSLQAHTRASSLHRPTDQHGGGAVNG